MPWSISITKDSRNESGRVYKYRAPVGACFSKIYEKKYIYILNCSFSRLRRTTVPTTAFLIWPALNFRHYPYQVIRIEAMDLFGSPKFSSRVKYLLEEHHVPGLAVALVQNETVVSAGYGNASLDPQKDCTPDTLFDIASASKSLTAASVGLLIADEKHPDLKYESTMSDLLPGDFVMPGVGYTEAVTVEDILSHRTGMPR
jgi:CubicO group peptidase (beta-lactamase class C family)